MATVYIAIGSNIGDKQTNIDKALSLLKDHPDIQIKKVSSFKSYAPFECEHPQEDFLNGAAELETDLGPLELFSYLRTIERRLGKKTHNEKNMPRPIDLDMLFYDDVVIVEGKNLCLPHPRMTQRSFVLEPLNEIAPQKTHPRTGLSVAQMTQNLIHESSETKKFS